VIRPEGRCAPRAGGAQYRGRQVVPEPAERASHDRRAAQYLRCARFRRPALHANRDRQARCAEDEGRSGRRPNGAILVRRDRGGAVVKNPRDVILAPVVSEKSYSAIDRNVYTFLV